MRRALIPTVIGVACGILGGAISPCQAQQSQPLQIGFLQGSQQSLRVPSSLQVTGNSARFTISANRADVLETLKLVFDQAEKQFAPNGNITGTVTMRLTDQPLITLLDAICKQTFLRYRFDQVNGIFHIERDENAVRNAVLKLRALDADMREQLRLMGLSVPSENSMQYISPRILNGGFSGTPTGAGGFGGGRASNGAAPIPLNGNVKAIVKPNDPNSAKRGANASVGTQAKDETQDRANNATEALTRPNDYTPSFNNSADYELFLKQNNFVRFLVPKEKPEPVYNILQQLGKQANVPLIVDPSVPRGDKFTVRGSLSPRPIMDALNILAPYARLEWRWVGDSIFVTASPEFDLILQDTLLSRNATRSATPPRRDLKEEKEKKSETKQNEPAKKP